MKIYAPTTWNPLAKMLVAVLAFALTTVSTHAQQGKEAALSPAEQQYLQGVAKENLGEIAASYFALEKAASEEVKSQAKDIVDTHTKTMKELMALAAKHDVVLSLEPDLSAYQSLQSHGGGDFDKVYAAELQRLNQQAIDTLNPLLGQITASDVKDFAQADLKDDKEHLKKTQELAAKLK